MRSPRRCASASRRPARSRAPNPIHAQATGTKTARANSVPAMEINKVGVVGCGLMGHGIAQICAQAGWDVVVREVDQDRLDAGLGKIDKQLARSVEKGKLEQADA